MIFTHLVFFEFFPGAGDAGGGGGVSTLLMKRLLGVGR